MNKIVVFGAGGRIGLPFSAYMASIGYQVTGVELNDEYVKKLNSGIHVPFREKGLDQLLVNYTGKRLEFVTYDAIMLGKEKHRLENARDIVVLVGTPLKKYSKYEDREIALDHSNLEALFGDLNDFDLTQKNIWLRSTVEIGQTRRMREILKTGNLYFWPERVIEGNVIHEFSSLRDIVGSENGNEDYVDIPGKGYSYPVTYEEAEFIKLATNTARYVQFSLANEFSNIAEEFGIDFNRIHELMTDGYERLSFLSYPGPNVGGPCLSKDPQVFVPYSLLIEGCDVANDTMLANIIRRIGTEPKRVLIIGSAFKEDSDDVRGSYSLDLYEKLYDMRHDVQFYDDFTESEQDNSRVILEIDQYDFFVLMTPHSTTGKLFRHIKRNAKDGSKLINYWGAKVPFERNPSSYIDIAESRKGR